MEQVLTSLGLGSLGAIIGFLVFKALYKSSTDIEQVKLDQKIDILDDKTKSILVDVTKNQETTKEKVKEIENEQNKEVTESNLIDFFNNRKH